jgi:phage FluMu gp28-like protein
MSAPVTPAMDLAKIAGASPRLITEAEWAKLRAESLQSLPPELVGLPPAEILLGYQKRLLESTATAAVTIVEKSRRTGATWALGADGVLTSAASRQAGGMDTLYIGYNLDMAREFIDVCAMWARSFGHAVSEVGETLFSDGKEDIQAFRINFASGFEILALSSRPRSLRGRQGYVIIDEAAFHDDLPALIQAALALLIWGGKVCIISTHNGDANPYNDLIKQVRAGKRDFSIVRFDFDDALRDGLYQRICQRKGEEWSVHAEAAWRAAIVNFYGEYADEELFCIPSQSGGAYLPAPLIEARMRPGIPVLRLEKENSFAQWPEHLRVAEIRDWCEATLKPLLEALDPALPHVLGEDFGRVSDLSVFVPLAIGRDLVRRAPFIVELRNVPFEAQRQILFYIIDRLPRFGGAKLDSTGNGQYLAEVAQQRYGAELIEAVFLNVPWYQDAFPKLKAAFEDAMIEIAADLDHLTDLRLVTTIAGVPRIPAVRTAAKGEDGKSADSARKRHGDFAVAVLLAWMASADLKLAYGYEPVPIAAGGLGRSSSVLEDQAYGGGIDVGFRGGL